jgi:hypothetical protein
MTRNFGYACRALKLNPKDASDLLHYYKGKAGLTAGDHCMFDTRAGDIIYNGEVRRSNWKSKGLAL